MKKLSIYFGCALAFGPKTYTEEIGSFKARLSEIPWIHVLEFCVPPPGKRQSDLPPADIYKNDIIDCVGNAHVVLGDLTYPSTGLGAELMAGMGLYKLRTMMFARETIENEKGEVEKTVVSKLWLGAPAHNSNATFQWYQNSIHEMFDVIVAELQKIHTAIQLEHI